MQCHAGSALLAFHIQQHSGSHSEAFANNQSTKNYERNKERILATQKRRYHENAEVEQLGSRAWCKAKYKNDPEPQNVHGLKPNMKMTWNHKRRLHVHGLKPNIKNDPDPQKTAARARSKVKYIK